MNTLDAVRRFSMYRGRLDDRKLSEEHLHQILDAARWAPSGHNSQPWEFAVVDEPDLIRRIAVIATQNYDDFLAHGPHLPKWVRNFIPWLRWSREDLERHGDGIFFRRFPRELWEEVAASTDEALIRERMVSLFGSHGEPSRLLTTAPCLIFTLLDTRREIPDFSGEMLALTSAGAAMQNLRLAARELGIAVHEQSVLYDLPETRTAVKSILGIPDPFRIVGAMRAGYRTDRVRSSFTHVRRPLEEIIHRNGYRS
jgi:nitroreductase